jgi:predicted Zn-ribbon and HTH transcriptional regulator
METKICFTGEFPKKRKMTKRQHICDDCDYEWEEENYLLTPRNCPNCKSHRVVVRIKL